MLPIERFNSRLQRTKDILEQRLRESDPGKISEALDGLKRVEKTLSWLPRPSNSGAGTADQASIRMSRGTR